MADDFRFFIYILILFLSTTFIFSSSFIFFWLGDSVSLHNLLNYSADFFHVGSNFDTLR